MRPQDKLVTKLRRKGGLDEQVLQALSTVPRERFIEPKLGPVAYRDRALPIACSQTISQPYIVAYMTSLLNISPNSTVLEIGTGSGYQTAVLAELARHVYTIEVVEQLATESAALLSALGYTNISFRTGDGYIGWPEEGPFDAIIVTAAPDHIPEPLVAQLALGGRMVIPVGDSRQTLKLLERKPEGVAVHNTLPVLFVPMTGTARHQE